MSTPQQSDVIEFTAGQIADESFSFLQSDGVTAVNLTGSTVHLVIKRLMSDLDADALVDAEQATHTDAAAGETTVSVDLSALDEKYAASGLKAFGIIWLVTSGGQRIPYGPFDVRIKPNPKRTFA